MNRFGQEIIIFCIHATQIQRIRFHENLLQTGSVAKR